jgi:hypothetical protein
MSRNRLAHAVKTHCRAFPLAEEHRQMFTCCVIQRHHQIPVVLGNSLVSARIAMHQHACRRRALALRAVLASRFCPMTVCITPAMKASTVSPVAFVHVPRADAIDSTSFCFPNSLAQILCNILPHGGQGDAALSRWRLSEVDRIAPQFQTAVRCRRSAIAFARASCVTPRCSNQFHASWLATYLSRCYDNTVDGKSEAYTA